LHNKRKGVVKKKQQAPSLVSVIVKGTTKGSQTDFDGVLLIEM
jgi:hypothetical protein